MATTTNYGWTTPDDTALVKDGAAAIRTLGSSVDTTTKALNPSTTLGDIEYRSSTANTNTRLGIGSTGNVLTVAGGVPSWAAPAGGGANWSLLNSGGTALTGAATITISGISGKDRILMLIEDASAGANSLIQIKLNADSGANYGMGAGSVDYGSSYSAGMSGSVGNATGLDGISFSNLSSNAASVVAGYIEWSGCNAAGVKMCTYASGTTIGSGGNGQNNYYGGGVYTGSSTISSISIFSNSGNFDAGNIYVYAT